MYSFFRSRKKDEQSERPRRRWGRRVLLFLLFVIALVWCAPIIVAHTDLRHWLVGQALGKLKGEVRVGSAELGWFSKPVVRDVEVKDEKGNRVAHIPELRLERTLLQLAMNSAKLGKLRIVEPVLHVVYDGKTTNVETMLENYLDDDGSPSSPLECSVEVSKAKLTLEDTQTRQKWVVHPLDAAVNLPQQATAPLLMKIDGQVKRDGDEQASALHADLAVRTEKKGDVALTKVEGKTKLAAFPLQVVEPLMRTVDDKAQLAGTLEGDFEWKLAAGPKGLKQLSAKGKASGRDLLVESTWLKGDRVHLQKLDLDCDISTSDELLHIARADIDCDVGTAKLAWTVDLRRPKMYGLGRAGQSVKADLDLVGLCRMLPNVLHLQEGTSVQSGRVHLEAGSAYRDNGTLWTAKMNATDLRWNRANRDYAWNDPLTLDVSLVQPTSGLPIIEKGTLEAGFAKAEASGTASEMTIQGTANLDALTQRLEQLVDVKGWRATGNGALLVKVTRVAEEKYKLSSRVELNNLRLPTTVGRVWQEDKIVVDLDGLVARAGGKLRVENGGVHANASGNVIDVGLTKPVADLSSGALGELTVRVNGDLAQLHQRAKAWTTATDDWKLAGRVEMTGRLRTEPEQVTFDQCRAKLANVDLVGAGLSLREPSLTMNLAGRWYAKTGKTELRNSDLVGPGVKVHLSQMVVESNPNGALQVSGRGTLDGQLAKLYAWISDPDPKPEDGMHGHCQGSIEFYPAEGRIGLKTDVHVRNFVYGLPTDPTWNEPDLHIVGTGRYESPADLLLVDNVRVKTDLVTCEGKGKIEQATDTMKLTLDGFADYDVARLEPYLREYAGKDLKLVGKGRGPLHLTGMLCPPGTTSMWQTLAGTTSLHWDSATALGCTLTGAKVNLELKEGWLRAQPVTSTLEQGRVRLLPSFRIDPDPMFATLAKGTEIERFNLTPELCKGAIKYALPVVGDVVEARGQLSLQLDEARIPIDNPMTGTTLSGRLIVHDAAVGANAVIREITTLFNAPSGVALTKESVIDFVMKEGWVHHRNLSMVVSGVPIRTSGWVCVDGRIQLMAECPIPAKWLGNSPLAATLAKERIRVPLRGTMSQPKLDEKALRQAAAEVAKRVAAEEARRRVQEPLEKVEDKILGELEKGLQGLNGPRRRP